MKTLLNLVDTLVKAAEPKENRDLSLEETLEGCFDFVKEKVSQKLSFLRQSGQSKSGTRQMKCKPRKPALTGFDISEKIASSPYYGGNRKILLQAKRDQVGEKLRDSLFTDRNKDSKTSRAEIVEHFKQKYALQTAK